MSRLTIAHLTCGCRVVLRGEGRPPRWDDCGKPNAHRGLSRESWFARRDSVERKHSADARQHCQDMRCWAAWETMVAEGLVRG